MTFRETFNSKLSALYTRDECGVLWRRALSAVCGVDMSRTYFITSDDLTPMQCDEIRGIAERLSKGEPLEYILGFAEFRSLKFKVTPATLIPRLETQELVSTIKEFHPDGNASPNILEVGTGSGCIAITLAKSLPNARITAVDISAEALQVAQENARTHQTPNIQFLQCDFLNPDATESVIPNSEKFDLIVSNPPYVRPSEKPSMPVRVLDYEPHTALFVPERDPLLFYRRIAEFSANRLTPQGRVAVEINQWLSEPTAALFTAHGFTAQIKKDLFSNPRIIIAEF
ncbi:MAG: peptide chain release factor N(5)-glutamine methyltransferase [Paludibacteraceae bacterium]|nr:peptide chain release factor N(5)-glutamine methyltransferase [Paludibacteraceae bacterium]